jgi:hypothetical protein
MKLRILASLSLVAAIGCGESMAPKVDPAIGGYMLTSANGTALPAPLPTGGQITSSTALDGSIFLDKDGTYSGIVELRIVRGTVTTTEPYGVRDGIWRRVSDTRLELLPKAGSELSVVAMTPTANTLTVISQGINYGYTRK